MLCVLLFFTTVLEFASLNRRRFITYCCLGVLTRATFLDVNGWSFSTEALRRFFLELPCSPPIDISAFCLLCSVPNFCRTSDCSQYMFLMAFHDSSSLGALCRFNRVIRIMGCALQLRGAPRSCFKIPKDYLPDCGREVRISDQ